MELRKSDKYKNDDNLEVAIGCLTDAFKGEGTKPSDELLSIYKKGFVEIHGEEKASSMEETPEKLKAMGNEAVKNEDYDTAISFYNRAIALSASNPFSATDEQRSIYYSNRSLCYINKYKTQENKTGSFAQNAISDGKEAVRLNPSYHKAWHRLGVAYELLNMKGEATKAYKEACNLAPNNKQYSDALNKLNSDEVAEILNDKNSSAEEKAEQLTSQFPFLNDIKNDPEILKLLSSPKFGQIMEEVKNNPMGILKYMNDPEFAPIMQKIMGKIMPMFSNNGGNGGANPFASMMAGMMGGANGN